MHAVDNYLMACISVTARWHEPCRGRCMTGVRWVQCTFALVSLLSTSVLDSILDIMRLRSPS